MTTHEDCSRARAAFSDLLDRRADGEVAFAGNHLDECAACANYYAAYQATVGATRGMEHPDAPAGLADAAWAAGQESGAGGARMLLWLSAGLAAAVLVWVGLREFGGGSKTTEATYGGADTTTVVLGELPPADRFLVLETFEDGGRALVSLADLQTQGRAIVAPGGSFQEYKVEVEGDRVTLRSGATSVRVVAADNPAQARARWAAVDPAAARPLDFQLLTLAALRGDTAALRELELLAEGDTKWAGSAREALGGEQSKLLASLIRLASDPGRPGRVDSIRSLAQHGAPQALAALRGIAREEETRSAVVAMQGLAELNDTASLPLLRELSASTDKDIARAAQAAVAKLLPPIPEPDPKVK